jgi:hypothetical protein
MWNRDSPVSVVSLQNNFSFSKQKHRKMIPDFVESLRRYSYL